MCLIRHAGEMATRTKSEEHEEVHVRNMVLVPATYSTVLQHGKLCKEAMKAFANHVFDDFRELDEESKVFIINNSYSSMNSLDSAYRAIHNFPNEEDIRNPGYTTYIRIGDLERFFANCPDDIDSAKIVSELRKGLERSGRGVRRYFKRVMPTDYEFLALLGLSFWNDGSSYFLEVIERIVPEISNLNEKVLQLAMKNRTLIMTDLHSYYSQQGIRDYAVRIGNLYCILVSFQNNVARLQEDFQLYRLMNLFKDYFDKHCD
ncbi:hypothetical protein PRIPAC_78164 [Pristionchus pacificus]|nr:hypothetical protein PRIPAC_78164 [Pristionchus pacificus]